MAVVVVTSTWLRVAPEKRVPKPGKPTPFLWSPAVVKMLFPLPEGMSSSDARTVSDTFLQASKFTNLLNATSTRKKETFTW
jgi:hypothetical protein